jgi:membrane fusion protein (multidrug efflux system)
MNDQQKDLLCDREALRYPQAPRQPGRARLGLALLATAAWAAVCVCKQEAAPPPPPPGVVVMDVVATNVPLEAEIIGQLDSPQNIEIRARVEAFVQEVPFIEGTNVTTGQLLFQLDDGPYRQRLAAAEGMLAEAKAALAKYRADTNRLTPLAKQRAVPQQDLENAIASVDVGAAGVLSAEARVKSALLDLSYCKVLAPTNGLIGAKQVSIGELVGKGQPTLMATMSTLDPIWAYCNVSEVGLLNADDFTRRTGKRIADAPVTLVRANGSVHPEQGRIVFIDRAVDVKTGTMRVRAEFPNPPVPPNPDPLLRPGMFGRLKLDLGLRPDSILVPERAVTELQGKSFVWVVGPDNKATQRSVTVGQQIGGSLLILEHLKPGERVVVEGVQKLKDGLEVRPMTMAQAAEAAQQAAASHAQAGAAKHGKE